MYILSSNAIMGDQVYVYACSIKYMHSAATHVHIRPFEICLFILFSICNFVSWATRKKTAMIYAKGAICM